LPAWWESLKEEFECPVCLESMTEAPIFQCDNPLGHSVCSKCNKTLKKDGKKCPMCRSNLSNRRNLPLEKMVEKLPKVKCKFEGCSFKKSDTEAGKKTVKKHEKNCQYRHIPCVYCDNKVPLKNIADHVTNHTGAVTFRGFSISRNSSKTCRKKSYQCVYRVEDNDEPTFLNNWEVLKDGIAMYWISFVGAKESAKNYMYTLKLGEANETGRYPFEGTRFCAPCDISHADMKKSKCCLVLDKELIKDVSYVEGNQRKFNFTVSIHKA